MIGRKMGLFSSDNTELVRIITRAEITGDVLKTSVSGVIKNYTKDLADLNYNKNKATIQKLNIVIKKLEDAQDRSRVYSGILPKDVLGFISEAEMLGSGKSSHIFKDYLPIKELGEKSLKKLKRKMIFPFVIFALATMIFNVVVGKFLPIAEAGTIDFSTASLFVMKNFLLINMLWGAFFAFFFLAIPKKIPMIKQLFSEIEGMMAVSNVIILHRLSYGASEMIQPLMNRFGLEKFAPRNHDINGLTGMLYKGSLLTDLQASDIRNSGSVTAQLEPALLMVFEEKRENVLLMGEVLDEVVKNMTILLIAVPVFSMLYVIISLLMGAMSLLN